MVGLIPGPSESPIHLNSYLDPLVQELKILWEDGILVTSSDYLHPINIKAALMCSACDIPACRKVLGFCGHASKHGCSKCTKEFEYDESLERLTFGGFSVCPLRTEEHSLLGHAAIYISVSRKN